jgi:hypothetical protein
VSFNRKHSLLQTEGRAAWRTVNRTLPFIWPVNNFDLRIRVVLAFLALVAAKCVAILSPLIRVVFSEPIHGNKSQGARQRSSNPLKAGAIGLLLQPILLRAELTWKLFRMS